MGAISFSTDFFHRDAVQHRPRDPNADRMEKAIIACEQKDAAIVHKALAAIAGWFMKHEDTKPDAMENAILACQRRDRAIVWKLLKGH